MSVCPSVCPSIDRLIFLHFCMSYTFLYVLHFCIFCRSLALLLYSNAAPAHSHASGMRLYNQVCLSIHPFICPVQKSHISFFFLFFWGGGRGEMVQQFTQDKLTTVGIIADRWREGMSNPHPHPIPFAPLPTYTTSKNRISHFLTRAFRSVDGTTDIWTKPMTEGKQVTQGHNIVLDGWAGPSNPTYSNIHKKNTRFINFQLYDLRQTNKPMDGRMDVQTKPLTQLRVCN